MKTLRIATWNMRAAFPKLKGPTKTEEMWNWAHNDRQGLLYQGFPKPRFPNQGSRMAGMQFGLRVASAVVGRGEPLSQVQRWNYKEVNS
jgi:hypothetical protein